MKPQAPQVKPVPGVHADAFREDHVATAQFHQQRRYMLALRAGASNLEIFR